MHYNNIIYFDTIPSTNTYLKENYQDLPHKTVVVAHHQTNGRGRMMRTWVDKDDLLFSILIKEKICPKELPNLALVTASSLFITLSKYVNNIKIKWPNDLVVNYKKMVGILIESIISKDELAVLIIGIGVNCNTLEFPTELKDRSTSIFMETNQKVDKERLLDEILFDFDKSYNEYMHKNNDYLDICIRESCLINQVVEFNDFVSKKTGKVVSILNNGNIEIEIDGKPHEYNYGEITLKNIYIYNQ